MIRQWYEVWVDETLTIPYLLLVVADESVSEKGVIILDPKEGMKIVYKAPSYEYAKGWLLEDEYIMVDGRMDK